MQQVSETSSVLVSVEFFANYIGKTPKAIRQMVSAGKLPVIRLKNPQNLDGEGEILIHRGEWDAYATEVAKTTDPENCPSGEDVNIGWQQRMKEFKDGIQVIDDAITLGEGGDFISLDAMAADLINSKIPAQHRSDPRLVVLVGADLVAAEQYRLYNKADRPTEKIAAQMLSSTIAGRPGIIPPFMPGKRMIVTPLSNLHIYTQRNTRQRKAEFVDDRKQYENKYLRNEGYAVEEPELYASYDESAVTIGKVPELADPKAGE